MVLNKIDVPEARELAEFVRPDLEAAGYRVFEVSTATHEGLPELRYALAEVVAADRARPTPAGGASGSSCGRRRSTTTQFTVEPDPEEPAVSSCAGPGPERWVRQTDFTNDEAVGYLADRLARLGVEERWPSWAPTPARR